MDKLKIDYFVVNWSTEVKYLGATIDKELHFTNHVHEITSKANGDKFTLFPLINSKSSLPLRTKLFIFKTYIRFLSRTPVHFGYQIFPKTADKGLKKSNSPFLEPSLIALGTCSIKLFKILQVFPQ